jgi:transcriptional regulator with XRE-family HTH domain
MNVVGKTVMRMRMAQELTREEFAARAQLADLDLSSHAVKRIEMGQRSVVDYELQKLARALRVPIGVFLEQAGITD